MARLALALLFLFAFFGDAYLMSTPSSGSSDQPLVLLLLGPPGSGKGTQAVRLSRELQLPHISTGDLLRQHLKEQTPLGRRAKEYIESGQLVPDELVTDMLFERISQPDAKKGYLLDGFPRTIPQAEALDARIQGKARLVVVQLDLPDEEIVKRLSNRMTCRQCGEIHNLAFSPPKERGKCDSCGGELFQRADDREQVIRDRLAVYREQTRPLIGHYSQQQELIQLSSLAPPDQVYQQLIQEVKKRAP